MAIKRCFDLKGSLHKRLTKISENEKVFGSGLNVLKDQNFLETDPLGISAEQKDSLMKMIELDTQLLRKHRLIDYSIFLLEVDRQLRLTTKSSLTYDMIN